MTTAHPVNPSAQLTFGHSRTKKLVQLFLSNISVIIDDRYRDRGNTQCDHSPDNVKFPDSLRHSYAAVSTHNMPVLSVVGVGMQQCMIRNHIFNI